MFPAFAIASCCAAVGIVMMLILKAMKKRADKGLSLQETQGAKV
jgi:hypothetical protein